MEIIATEQFRVVLTDENQQTGIYGSVNPALLAAVRFHKERGEACHVERRIVYTETPWEKIAVEV